MTPDVVAALRAAGLAVAGGAVGTLLLPLAVEVGAVLRLVRGAGAAPPGGGGATPRLLFLVPAHDEALLIGPCVRSIQAMRADGVAWSTWVLADGCTDDTVPIARREGARVLEPSGGAMGKARLLQWALPQLPLDAHDAIVIVDADSIVDPGFAAALARLPALRDVAAQARHGVRDAAGSWLTRLGDLLVSARYDGQLALHERVGLNAPLTGNGMCFGTELLARHGLGTRSITEDHELYARYTAAGVRIHYAAGARLEAQEPLALRQSSTQRERWQSGRLTVLRERLGEVARAPIAPLQKLDAFAELFALGPVLHASVALALAAALVPAGGAWRVLGGLALASLLPITGWTAWALARRPDRVQLLGALARLPFYALWRVGVALRLLVRGRVTEWRRSPRHAATDR